MKYLWSCALLCASVASAAGAPADPADAAFEKSAAEAMKAIQTREGAEYDEQLGHYLAALPGYRESMKKCTDASPGKQNVAGFFAFDEKGAYRVELRPKGAFADCVKRFLEGRSPPQPPKLPYLDPIGFTTDK